MDMPAQSTMTGLHESTLVAQLRAMQLMTRTEAQIASTRLAQARTEQVRAELSENSDNAGRRAARIGTALRDLNAVPDVVTPLLGRALALAKATLEQAQPLDEALLSDLALEHQLLDRARYIRTLADHLDRGPVVRLADDLVTAHEETVEWIEGVLAQEANGGPAALAPTPLQRVSGGITRLAGLPARITIEQVNRIVDLIARRTGEVRDHAEDTAREVTATVTATAAQVEAKAEQIGADVRDIATTGRDAALARTEEVADRRGSERVATAAHDARAELGTLQANELPVPHWEETTAPESIAAIRALQAVEDVRALLAFEQNHKNRTTVVAAATAKIDELTTAG